MLKNSNDNNFEDNNNENIQDSESEEENPNEPLLNLNISLNNGKTTNLSIYEGENIEQKIKQFCINNKISPKDEKVLMEKVKEELEIKSNSQLDTMNNDNNRITNKTVKEPKDIQNIVPKFMDYLPEEKDKLDHILNESESFSKSESVRQSNKDFEIEKEYKSNEINKFYNESESEKEYTNDEINKFYNESEVENKTKEIEIQKDGKLKTNILINKQENNKIDENKNGINNINNKPEINKIANKNYIINNKNTYLPNNNIILNNNNTNYTNNNINQNNLIIKNPPSVVYQVKIKNNEYNTNLNNNNLNNNIITNNINSNDINANNINKKYYTTKLTNTNTYTNNHNNINSNLNNTNSLINIKNNGINKYNSVYINSTNNNLLINNSRTNPSKVNNSIQTVNNKNNINYNINQNQNQNNPFSSLLNQNIEFLDYNSSINEALPYNINQNKKINYQNTKESNIYNFNQNEIVNTNNIISNNNPVESTVYNTEINTVNKNDSILYDFNPNGSKISEYTTLNNPNTTTPINYKNYDNIIKKLDNNYIINQAKQNEIKLNDPLIDYKNIINSNINGQKYSSYNNIKNNQMVQNKNSQESSKLYKYIYSQNNQYSIYENSQRQNIENNNINYNNIETPKEQFSIIENSSNPIIENVDYQIINNNSRLIKQSQNMENINSNNSKVDYNNNSVPKVNSLEKNNIINKPEMKSSNESNNKNSILYSSNNNNSNINTNQLCNENAKKASILTFNNENKNNSEIQGETSIKEKEISFNNITNHQINTPVRNLNNNLNHQINSPVRNINNNSNNYQIITNDIMLRQIEEKKQLNNKNDLKKEKEESINKDNDNNTPEKKIEISIINNSSIIDADNNNETKNIDKKKKSDLSNNPKESFNDLSNEINNIIRDETIEEKEPQDNCKRKKLKSDLPRDTDEINYKESQIKLDNNSSQNEPKKNNISINESNNINLSNHENSYLKNNDNIINNSKNVNNSIKNTINNSNRNSYNQIINNDELNNYINTSHSNYKSSDIKDYLEMSNPKYSENNKNKLNLNAISSYNASDLPNFDENEKYEKKLEKELGLNKPRYKNIIKLENLEYPQSQSYSSNTTNKNKNIYKKQEFKIKNSNKNKKPMKVLTFRNKRFDIKDINKRSNSSGIKKYKPNKKVDENFVGIRLYNQFMDKLHKKSQINERLLNEKLQEENKNIYSSPKIDPNSRRIAERLRNNEEYKVEERLINYGYNQRQKRLIQLANNDIRSRTESPFRPKINSHSRNIAARNKKNRISETISLMEEKKRRINYKRIDLEKEFGKRNRSIGNNHRNKNSFINFNESKSSDKVNNLLLIKNKNKYRKPRYHKDSNYNINSYRNTNNTMSDDNKTTMSQLNKTLELNKAYRELYNSIDDKNDTELTKYFANNLDLNSNITERNSQSRKISNLSEIKNNNLFSESRRPVTPPPYSERINTFDCLYYDPSISGEKNKKKQELNFRRNHPFKPKLCPYSKKLNSNRTETTKEFLSRISKNLEEIKIKNKSKTRKNKDGLNEQNNYNFIPKITRGPKNPNERIMNNNLVKYYDKKIKKETKDLKRMKKEEENEKKNIYNKKSKNIIMQMKIKKYRELFNQLDSDQDGFISSSNIHLTKIDQNILKNISPILENLNQTKKKMDFKEFCLKIDKIMTEK